MGKYWVLHCTHNTFALQVSNPLGPFMGTKAGWPEGNAIIGFEATAKGTLCRLGPTAQAGLPRRALHNTIASYPTNQVLHILITAGNLMYIAMKKAASTVHTVIKYQ